MSKQRTQTKAELQNASRNLMYIKQFVNQCGEVFFPDRPKILRNGLKLASLKIKRQTQALASGRGGRPSANERFGKGGFFSNLFNQEPQQQQPQQESDETIIRNEQEKQLLEDAQRRKERELQEQKDEEERKKLQRAREKISFENL